MPDCLKMSHDNPEISSARSPMDVAWKDIATKAALTAAVGGVAGMLLVPGGGSVSVLGMQVPQYVGLGIGAGIGSVAGDLAHNYVLPHIPQDQKWIGVETAAVSVGAAAAGAYVGMSMFGSVPIMTPLLIGGGSYIGADYLYHNVWDMKSGGFIY